VKPTPAAAALLRPGAGKMLAWRDCRLRTQIERGFHTGCDGLFWFSSRPRDLFSLTSGAVTRRAAPLLFIFSFCQVGLDALLSGKHRLRLSHFSSLQW
jgi:hypothetical protein